MSPAPRLRFPYMLWARTEALRSPYSLSQASMPPAPAALFAHLGLELGDAAPLQVELERALARLFRVEPERVLVTPGASAAQCVAALRWFRPGARVVSDVPSHEPLRALPELLGAEQRFVRRRPERAWRIDARELRSALADAAGPAHLLTSNPHEPSGALQEEREIAALAQECARRGGLLVCCESAMEFVPSERRVHAFALAPNALSIGSLGPAYGLGALRIGWIVLGSGLATERASLQDLCFLAHVDPCSTALRAARHALERLPDLLQALRRVEHDCRPHFVRWLGETPGIECAVPEFGIVAFPRIAGVEDTVELARFLQREAGVDTVPGEFFGLSGHLRLSCALPEATLVEGLALLERGIAAYRAGKR